jgi:acyl dehydratase
MSATRGPSAGGSLAAGDRLPPFTLVLTLQRLVMEAAANRDFAPIHFDAEAARQSGALDVYVNTTFIETLFEALLRSWAGLAARIRMIEFSMKAFNCVGDEVAACGEVVAVRDEDTGGLAELNIWVEGPRGLTVTGAAVVAFPRP